MEIQLVAAGHDYCQVWIGISLLSWTTALYLLLALSAPPLNLQMPDANTLKDTLVLSGKEWDRINQQLYRRQLEQEKIKAIREEKETRKQLSKDMVKDWPNTLEVGFTKQQHKAPGQRTCLQFNNMSAIESFCMT